MFIARTYNDPDPDPGTFTITCNGETETLTWDTTTAQIKALSTHSAQELAEGDFETDITVRVDDSGSGGSAGYVDIEQVGFQYQCAPSQIFTKTVWQPGIVDLRNLRQRRRRGFFRNILKALRAALPG